MAWDNMARCMGVSLHTRRSMILSSRCVGRRWLEHTRAWPPAEPWYLPLRELAEWRLLLSCCCPSTEHWTKWCFQRFRVRTSCPPQQCTLRNQTPRNSVRCCTCHCLLLSFRFHTKSSRRIFWRFTGSVWWLQIFQRKLATRQRLDVFGTFPSLKGYNHYIFFLSSMPVSCESRRRICSFVHSWNVVRCRHAV